MRVKFLYFILIIITLPGIIFSDGFSLPDWAQEHINYFIKTGFIKEKEGYNIYALKSRILSAKEVNTLLYKFGDSPEAFSTSEIMKLGQLTSELADELRFINTPKLNTFTTILKLLQNRIISTKSVILATSFHTIGEQGTIENTQELIHKNSVRAQVHLDQAKKLFEMKNYNRALIELNTALNNYPNYLAACFWAGRVHVKKGEYDKAILMWEKVVSTLGNRIYISDFIDKVSDYNEVFMEMLEVLSQYPENQVINRLIKTLQDNLRTQ
ncbi:MAG: hypothetical protein WC002_03615 [Candidatus Muiribacteriota bacterium]